MENILDKLKPFADGNIQKDTLIYNTKLIFESIHASYPWITAEIFINLQNQSGIDHSFIEQTLSPLFNDIEEEKLMQLATECAPVEESTQSIAVDLEAGNIDFERILSALSRDALSLNQEINPACLPCDDNSTAFVAGVLGESAQQAFTNMTNINRLKSYTQILEDYYSLLKKQDTNFQQEISALNNVLNTLASRCS